MSMDSNACTGSALYNYDRFAETLTGKGTLHNTVGITYQIVKLDNTIHHNP